MIKPTILSPEFSVSPQIEPGDLATLKAMGFATIINNRPDSEIENGFTSELVKAEAERVGLSYHYLPVGGLVVTDETYIDKTGELIAGSDTPIFAYCKSGTRSALLWGLNASRTTHPDKVIEGLATHGFEFDFLEEEFEEQWIDHAQNSGDTKAEINAASDQIKPSEPVPAI